MQGGVHSCDGVGEAVEEMGEKLVGARGMGEKGVRVGAGPPHAGAEVEIGAAAELALLIDGVAAEIAALGKALHKPGGVLGRVGIAQDQGGYLALG